MEKIFLKDEYERIFSRIANGDNITVLRYGDGERAIMTGEKVVAQEGWSSEGDSPLATALKNTLTLDNDNVFYGISCPCCDRPAYYWYSTHIKSKNITFANLFVNSNYQSFKRDFKRLTRDAVVIANQAGQFNTIGNLNVLKYYPVGDDCINYWETECGKLVSQIIRDFGDRENLLYVVSAGPMAEPIIYELYKNNPNNCYVDFGSSIDAYIHGSDSRPYSNPNTIYAKRNCWMFRPDKVSFNVSVVLTSYKKPDALERQLAALEKQTLKPSEIILFQDGIDSYYSINFEKTVLGYFDDVRIEKSNRGVWERFNYARSCKNDYVCLFDDDTIPGDCWLESCHFAMMNQVGIYGAIGVVLQDPAGYPLDKSKYYRVGWAEPNKRTMQVDFVGHSWFLPKFTLDYMFEGTEALQNYKIVAEDMTLSLKAAEHGIMTYVPPHPFNDHRVWGSDPALAMRYGQADGALSMNFSNLTKMQEAITEFSAMGFQFLYERDMNLVHSQKNELSRYHQKEKLRKLYSHFRHPFN